MIRLIRHGYLERLSLVLLHLPETFHVLSSKLDCKFGRVDGAVEEELESSEKLNVANSCRVSQNVFHGVLNI